MPGAKESLHSAKSKKKATAPSKGRSRSSSPSKKKSAKGKGKAKKSRSRSMSPKKEVDIMSKPAMENAYYISHNVPQFLGYRGFGWEGAAGKTKKKGKKKGKKK